MTIDLWLGLALGLAPYLIKHSSAADGATILEIRALAWGLYVARQPDGLRDWALRITLIDWARGALAAAVVRLRMR